MMEPIEQAYYKWLLRFVYDESNMKKLSYQKLLQKLYSIPFRYLLEMDGNRAVDGEMLRYRFGRQYGCRTDRIDEIFVGRPCSILELMVALAIRCEDQIMSNDNYGDRTGQWFWNMIQSLGLGHMHDDLFDEMFVEAVCEDFMNRNYAPDGSGGLFTVPGRTDMRQTDIWYQMHNFLHDID